MEATMIELPVEAEVLHLAFEYRIVLYSVFWALWLAVFLLAFRHRKLRFQWPFFTVSAVLFLCLQLGCVYAGWRYRMELRDRFAAPPEVARKIAASPFRWTYGRKEAFDAQPDIRLSRMPAEALKRYSAHNSHPRFRDLLAMLVGSIPSAAILVLLQFLLIWVLRYTLSASRQHSRISGGSA